MSAPHIAKRARPCAVWRPVIDEICQRHNVSLKDVASGFRAPHIVACRHEIWRTLYRQFRSSYETIGQRLGGFDHTTVRHAVLKAESRDA